MVASQRGFSFRVHCRRHSVPKCRRKALRMGDLLAPVTVAFGGEGWWGILLFVPLLLAGHVSEVAVGYGLWRRIDDRPPSPRVWRVAAISGAVAVASLIAAMTWVAVYAAPRLATDLTAYF